MVLTFLLSLLITGINQSVKLLARWIGVSKSSATKIVFFIGFLLSIAFTMAEGYGLLTPERITSVVAMFMASIGTYEVVLRKLGIDSLSKDLLGIKRKEDENYS